MMAPRYATPKEQSTTLHASNKVNKDLALRGTEKMQQPETIPSVERPPGESQAPVALPPVTEQQPALVSC